MRMAKQGSGADGGGLVKIKTLKVVMVVTAKGWVGGSVEVLVKLVVVVVVVTKVTVMVAIGGRAGADDGVGGESGGNGRD